MKNHTLCSRTYLYKGVPPPPPSPPFLSGIDRPTVIYIDLGTATWGKSVPRVHQLEVTGIFVLLRVCISLASFSKELRNYFNNNQLVQNLLKENHLA